MSRSKLLERVAREAIARFPDSPSRQNDFVDSWWGIHCGTKRQKLKIRQRYGNGRRNRTGVI